MNDPFSYNVGPTPQSLLDKGMPSMNLPVTTGPSSVSSLGGGGNMWLPAIQGGIQALSGIFAGRRQSREAERDREIQRQRLGLERSRFGLEKQQYQDAMARQRAQSEFMNPMLERYRGGFGDIGKVDSSKYKTYGTERQPRGPSGQDLMNMFSSLKEQRAQRRQNTNNG